MQCGADEFTAESLRWDAEHPSILAARFSVYRSENKSMERNPLRELRVWTAEHLTADLSVPALAQRVAMSPRNFQRVFTSGAGKSPAR